MEGRGTVTEYLLAHCAAYPALEAEDLLKALHQGALGCGHLRPDAPETLAGLRAELAGCAPAEAPVEALPGDVYCRLPLALARYLGLRAETVLGLQRRAAAPVPGGQALLEQWTGELEDLAPRLPWPAARTREAAESFRRAGFPPCRHSPAVRAAYAPAYRVILRRDVWFLPLLSGIDRTCAGRERTVVALEGGSASGKTTLAAALRQIYGCEVFHMDDFFLQPWQRTPQRLAQPGGNVDRERFFQEVLRPLRRGEPVCWRRFDCHAGRLLEPQTVRPGTLTVVEGAYSMHPDLAEAYDFSAFLRISPELQRRRVQQRNTPREQEQFFSRWIPLEQAYFDALDPLGRCDLILEVQS